MDPLIKSILAVHRPLAFPALLAADNHTRLVSAIVARMDAAASAIAADVSRIRAPVLPAVQDAVAQRRLREYTFCILLVEGIAFGLDVTDAERAAFFRGHEAELFAATLRVLDHLPHPERAQPTLARLAFLLWHDAPAARCAPKPLYFFRIEAELAGDMRDPYVALHCIMNTAATRRFCRGPACGKPVHEKATPGSFARCAQCGVVQYCSKDCQRADWTGAPVPHKTICRLLRGLFAFASLDMSPESFSAACASNCLPLESVDTLISWGDGGEIYTSHYASEAPILADVATYDAEAWELDLSKHASDMAAFKNLYTERADGGTIVNGKGESSTELPPEGAT